jgi:hypothetical protein
VHDDAALLVHGAVLHVNLQHLLQLCPRVNVADFLSQGLVQDVADGIGHDVQRKDEDLDNRERQLANLQRVAGAQRLRDDLAEDNNDDGGNEETKQAARHVGHQNRKHGIHRHVAQQQRAQQQISFASHGQDGLGAIGELRVVAANDDLEPNLVQAQQAQREARKQGRHADQKRDHKVVHTHGQCKGRGRFFAALRDVVAHDAHCQGHRQ